MIKAVGKIALFSVVTSVAIYAASTAGCKSCHGQNFEKKALGKSKIVKDMSKDEIVKALKGYKDGSYGGAMKGMMAGQVKSLSDADIEAIAAEIKGGGTKGNSTKAPAKEEAPVKKGVKELSNEGQYSAPDLTKSVDEKELGLRKTSLEDEKVTPPAIKDDAPAPGQSQRIARSYVNAPPLIPHSVDGLLPITRKNNSCLGCHMPDKAKDVGATPIPPSHFTDFRPTTKMVDGKIEKDGKVFGKDYKNTSDIKIAKFKKLKKLSMARFNCSQCHVPQANVKPLVKNNFKADFKDDKQKEKSNLLDVINQGVK